MLSITCKTGIKAVLYLAKFVDTDEKKSIPEISEKIDSSLHTVSKVLQVLVKEGIINSVKGPHGGFYITHTQSQLTIIKIVRAIDGANIFKACGLGLHKCNATKPCPIHFEYEKAKKIIENLLVENTINTLATSVVNKLSFLVN
jgi:Rrf2 family protein